MARETREGPRAGGEVLFEFRPVGRQMRVAAIDVATNTEVVVIAPLGAAEHEMRAVALAKLKRALARRADR